MRLTVITGPMFAGKSTALTSHVRRWRIAGRKVLVVKPLVDTRSEAVRTHDGQEVETYRVPDADLAPMLATAHESYLAIDEAQFFSPEALTRALSVWQGRHAIVAGLNRDYRGQPFPSIATVLPFADEIITVEAICTNDLAGGVCGAPASHTQFMVNGTPVTDGDTATAVGGSESYQARCWSCLVRP